MEIITVVQYTHKLAMLRNTQESRVELCVASRQHNVLRLQHAIIVPAQVALGAHTDIMGTS